MKSDFNVTYKINGRFVKIYINNVLHLAFYQSKLIGFQSWKEGKNWYCIELSLQDDITILTEYDSSEKWKKVIEVIDQIIL